MACHAMPCHVMPYHAMSCLAMVCLRGVPFDCCKNHLTTYGDLPARIDQVPVGDGPVDRWYLLAANVGGGERRRCTR